MTEAMYKHPDFNLIITGHSLGAGTAELITLNILSRNVDYIDPLQTNIKCIALAPPPVYRSTVKLPKEMKEKIEIYINNNDCVPRLSLGVIAQLLAKMKAVDALPLTTTEQLQLLAGVLTAITILTRFQSFSTVMVCIPNIQNPNYVEIRTDISSDFSTKLDSF